MDAGRLDARAAAPPLAFAATPRSRFDAALLARHLAEAAEFVARCQRAGQPVLDPCGPRGDLYFLLKAALEPASRHTRPAASARQRLPDNHARVDSDPHTDKSAFQHHT
jgi:hypothetical protein